MDVSFFSYSVTRLWLKIEAVALNRSSHKRLWRNRSTWFCISPWKWHPIGNRKSSSISCHISRFWNTVLPWLLNWGNFESPPLRSVQMISAYSAFWHHIMLKALCSHFLYLCKTETLKEVCATLYHFQLGLCWFAGHMYFKSSSSTAYCMPGVIWSSQTIFQPYILYISKALIYDVIGCRYAKQWQRTRTCSTNTAIQLIGDLRTSATKLPERNHANDGSLCYLDTKMFKSLFNMLENSQIYSSKEEK